MKVHFSLFLRGCQATSYWLHSVRVAFSDRTDVGRKERGHGEVLYVLTAAPGMCQRDDPLRVSAYTRAEDVTACVSRWYICCVLLLAQKGGKGFWPQPVTPVGLFLGQAQHSYGQDSRTKTLFSFQRATQTKKRRAGANSILAFQLEPPYSVLL